MKVCTLHFQKMLPEIADETFQNITSSFRGTGVCLVTVDYVLKKIIWDKTHVCGNIYDNKLHFCLVLWGLKQNKTHPLTYRST